jgi:hypothetical protein
MAKAALPIGLQGLAFDPLAALAARASLCQAAVCAPAQDLPAGTLLLLEASASPLSSLRGSRPWARKQRQACPEACQGRACTPAGQLAGAMARSPATRPAACADKSRTLRAAGGGRASMLPCAPPNFASPWRPRARAGNCGRGQRAEIDARAFFM